MPFYWILEAIQIRVTYRESNFIKHSYVYITFNMFYNIIEKGWFTFIL